jgi:DNA-binding XRE family transcriptional regulator
VSCTQNEELTLAFREYKQQYIVQSFQFREWISLVRWTLATERLDLKKDSLCRWETDSDGPSWLYAVTVACPSLPTSPSLAL